MKIVQHTVKVKGVTYAQHRIVLGCLFDDETGHSWLCSLVMSKRGDDRKSV